MRTHRYEYEYTYIHIYMFISMRTHRYEYADTYMSMRTYIYISILARGHRSSAQSTRNTAGREPHILANMSTYYIKVNLKSAMLLERL